MLSADDLLREAASTGFRAETLEKVLRLIELLEGIRSHPFLKSRVALKGGTAFNLFVFDVPRLSVDVDLNYVGTADRDAMLRERPRVEQAIRAVCGRLGIQIHRAPGEHAGGKWRLSYSAATGRPGTLALDVNFLLRTPLWPVTLVDSKAIGSFKVTQVPMLDIHELTAGKLSALFSRTAIRDLFDVRALLKLDSLDHGKLRLGFVVYGGINRRDWRKVRIEDIRVDPDEVGRYLVPLLRAGTAPDRRAVVSWTEQLVTDCRDLLAAVLPLRPSEMDFLDLLNDQGEIAPELLTGDKKLQSTVRVHPGLKWKAMNVRRHRGLADTGEEK